MESSFLKVFGEMNRWIESQKKSIKHQQLRKPSDKLPNYQHQLIIRSMTGAWLGNWRLIHLPNQRSTGSRFFAALGHSTDVFQISSGARVKISDVYSDTRCNKNRGFISINMNDEQNEHSQFSRFIEKIRKDADWRTRCCGHDNVVCCQVRAARQQAPSAGQASVSSECQFCLTRIWHPTSEESFRWVFFQ